MGRINRRSSVRTCLLLVLWIALDVVDSKWNLSVSWTLYGEKICCCHAIEAVYIRQMPSLFSLSIQSILAHWMESEKVTCHELSNWPAVAAVLFSVWSTHARPTSHLTKGKNSLFKKCCRGEKMSRNSRWDFSFPAALSCVSNIFFFRDEACREEWPRFDYEFHENLFHSFHLFSLNEPLCACR